jgi:hypothetical protein
MPDFVGSLVPPRLDGPPSSPKTGQIYYNEIDALLYWWDGTSWITNTPGASGATGDTGPTGDTGDTGDTGPTGDAGIDSIYIGQVAAEPGLWQPAFPFTGALATAAHTNAQVRWTKVVFLRPIQAVRIDVTALNAQGRYRIGLYDEDPVTGAPRNLIVQTAEMLGTAVAMVNSALVAPSGRYWMAIGSVGTGAATLRTVTGANPYLSGVDQPLANVLPNAWLTTGQATGAAGVAQLPAVASLTGLVRNSIMPAVWVQTTTGPTLLAGEPGPQGPIGDTGAQGDTGDTGDTGPTGADSTVPGPTGDTGDTGPTGADSTVAGPTGDTGPTGPGVPDGGSTGQALIKASDTDLDTEWGVGGRIEVYVGDTEPVPRGDYVIWIETETGGP